MEWLKKYNLFFELTNKMNVIYSKETEELFFLIVMNGKQNLI